VKDDIYNSERRAEMMLNSLASLEKKEDVELIKSFVKVIEAQGLSKTRVNKYIIHLKLVSRHLKVTFKEAKKKDIEEFFTWLNSQSYSPQTVQGIIVVLKRFYQWLRAKPEEYEEWKKIAKSEGQSLFEFVKETVESVLKNGSLEERIAKLKIKVDGNYNDFNDELNILWEVTGKLDKGLKKLNRGEKLELNDFVYSELGLNERKAKPFGF